VLNTGQTIATYLTNPLQALKTAWNTPLGFSVEAFAVNLGLLSKEPAGNKGIAKAELYHDISIDLLAGRRRALSVPIVWRKFLVPASIILLIILLIPLVSLQRQAASTTQQLNTQLDRINHMLNLRRMMLDENKTAQLSIDALNTKTQAIQNDMIVLSGKGDLATILNTLIQNLPANAEFVSIVSTATDINLLGLAGSREAVIQYVQTLSGSETFSQVRLAVLESGNNPDPAAFNINFTVVLKR